MDSAIVALILLIVIPISIFLFGYGLGRAEKRNEQYHQYTAEALSNMNGKDLITLKKNMKAKSNAVKDEMRRRRCLA